MQISSYFKRIQVQLIVFLVCTLAISTNISCQKDKIPFNQSSDYKLMLGERIFYGTIINTPKQPSCASCHEKYTTDEINWNPTLAEIKKASDSLSAEEFKAAINSPKESFLAKVHKEYTYTDEQLVHLQQYLKNLKPHNWKEKPQKKPRLHLFIFFGVLMTVAIVDLLFTKQIRYKAIHILVLILGVYIHIKIAYHEAATLGRSQGYMPDQPIKFSHLVHAGTNKIDCKYCHFNAEHGKSAGIPGPELCMNCHLIVREGSNSGKYEIAKVIQHFEKNKDIKWTRIHNLPDHVYFNHAQHVKAAQLDCDECHGKVEEMHIAKQANDLSMGWCLDCHKKTNVQFLNNDYYTSFNELHNDIASEKKDTIRAVDIGANDCMKCHY
jgi:cytochrome c553